jgi:hypothetical protein
MRAETIPDLPRSGQGPGLFGIEIEGYVRCGSKLKIIASIGDPQVISSTLSHHQRTAPEQYAA